MENHSNIGDMDEMVTSSVPNESALKILDQEIRFQDFSPEGFWIAGCMEPYKAMSSNHKLIMKKNEMLVLRLQSKDGHTGGKIIVISFYKGSTINDLGAGPEEIEKKKFLMPLLREKNSF